MLYFSIFSPMCSACQKTEVVFGHQVSKIWISHATNPNPKYIKFLVLILSPSLYLHKNQDQIFRLKMFMFLHKTFDVLKTKGEVFSKNSSNRTLVKSYFCLFAELFWISETFDWLKAKIWFDEFFLFKIFFPDFIIIFVKVVLDFVIIWRILQFTEFWYYQ